MSIQQEHLNNGMMTKIWGRPGWTFNHTVTFGYPLEPNEEQKMQYREYFLALGNVLPCRHCRDSYNYFVRNGDTALTDKDLENRDSLVKWLYRVHEAVNRKLGVDYGMTPEKLAHKYESFRARCSKDKTGCVAPLDYKAFSYSKLYEEDAPIIPIALAKEFIPLANYYGLGDHKLFFEIANQLDNDYEKIMAQPFWTERNKQCSKLIKRMKLQAIPSITGDTPTKEEVALIMYGCSNLSLSALIEANKKPPTHNDSL